MKGGARQLGPAYQGALEAVLSVVIAMGLGAWADSHFGTSPLLLLLGLVVGFGTFSLRLWRLTQESDHRPGADGGAGNAGSDRDA